MMEQGRDGRGEGKKQLAETLRVSEMRYRRLFESAQDGILILDAETGMIVDVNPFLVGLLGLSREHFLTKKVWELGFFKDVIANEANFKELQDKKYIRYENIPLKTADGRRIAVEFVSNVYSENSHDVIQCNIRDISVRQRREENESLALEILHLLNCGRELNDLVQQLVKSIKRSLDIDAVGLRLRLGEDFPYYVQDGFSDAFVRQEDSLCAKDKAGGVARDAAGQRLLECTCGLVLSGGAHQGQPFFTKRGSFLTNRSSTLLLLTPEDDPRTHPRNRCIHDGYQSIALIPLRSDEEIIGLLQLNDRRPDRFPPEVFHFLEGIAESIGVALKRIQADAAACASEARFKNLFESSRDAIMTLEPPSWKFTTGNRATIEMFRAKNEAEFILCKPWSLSPDRQPDKRASAEKAMEMIETAMREGSHSFEWMHRRISGEEFPADILLTRMEQDGKIGLQSTVRDITERKRLENYTRTLLEITTGIAGGLTLDALLGTVQRTIAESLSCDVVATLLLDPVREALRVTSHHGIPLDLLAPALALEFRTAEWLGDYLGKGEPLVINDFGSARLPAELSQFPLGALMAIPLRVRGRYFGRLCAVRGRERPSFATHEVALFDSITQQVAIGIETVQLIEKRQEDSLVSAALARLSTALSVSLHTPRLIKQLCQVGNEILDGNVSVSFFRQPKEFLWTGVERYGDTTDEVWWLFRDLPIPEAPIADALAWIDREGVLLLGDAEISRLLPAPIVALVRQSGLTAVMLMALRRDGELIGVLATGWRGGPERVSAQHERIGRGISQVASIALENKRLIDGLESANEIKSNFMSTMSHELRTPLNVILGYNALLLEGAFGSLGADQVDTLQRTQKSAAELHALLTATLDIGRLETGMATADVQEIDMIELLSEIAAEATSAHEKPTVVVVWDAPTELPRLRIDRVPSVRVRSPIFRCGDQLPPRRSDGSEG